MLLTTFLEIDHQHSYTHIRVFLSLEKNVATSRMYYAIRTESVAVSVSQMQVYAESCGLKPLELWM